MIDIWFGVFLCFLLAPGSAAEAVRADQIVLVILRGVTGPPVSELRREITRQFDGSSPVKPFIHVVPGDLYVKGAWTLLPLFPKLVELHPNATWLVILQETTRINWTELVDLTQRFDPDKEWFIGRELFDKEPTIVHHFAFHHDPSAFKYPLGETGMLLSWPAVKRVHSRIAGQQLPRDFSIDAQHELAVYLMEGVNMTRSSAFCLRPGPSCATWIQPFKPCGTCVDAGDVFFAVKTWSKFHTDRVPIVQRTWARQAHQLVFFSDVADERIPTISLGVPNTESGHCSKTMAIIDHLHERMASIEPSPRWYVIADDDSIIGVRKLREFLTCHDPSRPLLIGQRYGYASGHNYGYDYITGGGGMVLSRTALRLIAGNCRCPAPDTPDDMWLGACSESLAISIVHFSGFHQARPDDYPMELLQTQFVISFHKHWMLDPVQVYETWFADEDDVSISPPVDDDSGCSVMDPSLHCHVKQQPAELFQSTSIERLPDEL
ncbi:hypothetical protein GHT06_021495 [Daphnia sinensis]|uniref:Fringe-like glycosyltransferase domain-containing protein n=1 Tax=Daphnia sinensis TaxID=1820382 RepID=A0AAD5PSJ5_9CRUS|nr:hypothetical protein GHT06_021495 [Daphnia sinensis]